MNHRLLLSLATAFGLLFSATTHAADSAATTGDIALYLAPDAATPAFMHAPAGDARLTAPQPAAAGWMTVSLPGPFTAYVQSNHTHKDLSVIPGTPIHAAANSNSPILGVAPENPPLSIKEPEIDWSEVSFAGPVTVYFQKIAPPSTPEVVTPVVSAQTKPAAVTSMPSTTPVTGVTVVTAVGTAVPQYYYGVLKLRTNPFIDGPINAQYLLYGEKGALVALVDLSNVVLSRPTADYLGKSVKIYGTAYTDSNLPSLVIKAQMLQAN